MDQENVILNTEQMVRDQLLNEESGHDWYHIERVTKTARQIAKKENANLFIVVLASLLHDLADDKVVESESKGIASIQQWLNAQQVESDDSEHILSIIQHMSFKGGNGTPLKTIEGQVVQDADRLDAIGAVGIARCFLYSGKKGQPIYDPTLKVREQMSKEEYRHGNSSAIHHFYEKLLKLKDLMNTETGQNLANERHQFMLEFLEQFFDEVKD